ncbi:MAG TPA: lipocalin-like domain-containing protein [Thermomicrobiales bacterium]|nr:lipocalin-like domain-containing protein [Thermomicrobiales bacterium]
MSIETRLSTLATVMRHRASRRQALHGLGLSAIALANARSLAGATPAPARQLTSTPATTGAPAADELDDLTKDYIAQALWLDEWDESAIPAPILEKILSEQNSNRAFGERMTARIQALIDEPETFTPSYADRYAEFLEHTSSMNPHQVYAMSNLLGADNAKDFPPLPPKADFTFPQNFAVDLDRQVGWYFVVGSCTGSNGKEYGIELMFFRNMILPPHLAEQFGIDPTENQITELHFAVTEAGGRHHRAIPIIIAGTTGLLEFAPDGLGWSMGENKIASLDPTTGALPLHFRGRGIDRGGDSPVTFSADIISTESDPLSLQGVEGCDPCCDGVGTLYYSITNLNLDPERSSLTIGGEVIPLESGRFWFDHQWGTSLVASPRSEVTRAAKNLDDTPNVGGWDWFSAQFDDGRQISGSSLHTAENLGFFFQTGEEKPGVMEAPVNGRLMTGTGHVQLFTGTVIIDDWVRSTTTPDPDIYAPSNTWHPNHWTYTFGDDIPEELRTFSMAPIVDGGQSGFFAHGIQYSEGASYVYDSEGNEIGRGFSESVNYADTVDQTLRLAGLPVDEEMISLLQAPVPSNQLKSESINYVLKHQADLNDVIAACIGI